ncbi:hypothetical protein H7H73_20805 [Mycobacterium rufum]|uniref:Uncharacterized protein n=1 Tax=Mycolicibacterium rufum TaxID=318424 RepID=A0A9X2YFS9_9MYCO|nr:hypothetical protein [Mycolicibacterium rufum]
MVVATAALLTVMVTGADSVVLPLVSMARAVTVWVPLATVALFQDTL